MPAALSVLVASALAAALATSAAVAEDLVPEELKVDDECTAGDSGNQSECALNALQYRGAKRTDADSEEALNGTQLPWGCWGCMAGNSMPGVPSLNNGQVAIQHYAQNCWYHCDKKPGFCDFCGTGNACCRYMASNDPPECSSAKYFPALTFHTCVQPAQTSPSTPSGTGMPSTSNVEGAVYEPENKALAAPSDAPLLSFYMYRAMGENDYAPANVNAATLAGIMWYLHNEVVVMTPRKFGITRIVRMKVQTKASATLHEIGMNFGVRYAFDSGRCTGPWLCDKQFKKYGYFVGCNYVSDFPTLKWAKENHYKDAIWYSLPGPCSSRSYNMHDQKCVMTEPGGACSGTPTGRGNCTYSAEPAGEISIDELEGISDYKSFMYMGGKEYVHSWDRGIGMTFWDGKTDPEKCAARVKTAEDLFAAKYGPPELLDTPKCDFYQKGFFENSPHE